MGNCWPRIVKLDESADGTFASIVAETWPVLVIVNLLGVALACVCFRRQTQYGQQWTWVWVAFVFLLGLPGMMGYLFHRHWPARQPCPKCSAVVPRDRESCCACGDEFPPPSPKGIEVLA